MHCRDCEHLERKNIDVWRCRLTGAHLSAEELDADYPCPRDVGANPKGSRSRQGPGRQSSPASGVLNDLADLYAAESGKIRALWESGATPEAIAAAVGCSRLVAHYFVSRLEREETWRRGEAAMEKAKEALAAVTPAAEGNGEAKPLTKDELYARIAEMRRRGAGWAEIQRDLGVSPNVVHAALERHGLLKRGIRRCKPAETAEDKTGVITAEAHFPATSGPPVTKMTYTPAREAANESERPRPLIAGLAKTLAGGAAAQFLRGIGSSLELLPGRFRISVRVEEVSEHAEV